MRVLLSSLLLLTFGGAADAHGGGLDANGCHHDRKRGGYHCHRAPAGAQPLARPTPVPSPTVSTSVPFILTPQAPPPNERAPSRTEYSDDYGWRASSDPASGTCQMSRWLTEGLEPIIQLTFMHSQGTLSLTTDAEIPAATSGILALKIVLSGRLTGKDSWTNLAFSTEQSGAVQRVMLSPINTIILPQIGWNKSMEVQFSDDSLLASVNIENASGAVGVVRKCLADVAALESK